MPSTICCFCGLCPVFPFWLVNIAPAVAGVSLGTYALTTLIGIIPGTFAFAVLGSGLDSIIEAQKAMHDACIAEKGASELHLLARCRRTGHA
jgi:uncharacterized membrane protein YdjX (TVP38/TMEM64 family)